MNYENTSLWEQYERLSHMMFWLMVQDPDARFRIQQFYETIRTEVENIQKAPKPKRHLVLIKTE